jgi:hypothetical protein
MNQLPFSQLAIDTSIRRVRGLSSGLSQENHRCSPAVLLLARCDALPIGVGLGAGTLDVSGSCDDFSLTARLGYSAPARPCGRSARRRTCAPAEPTSRPDLRGALSTVRRARRDAGQDDA